MSEISVLCLVKDNFYGNRLFGKPNALNTCFILIRNLKEDRQSR